MTERVCNNACQVKVKRQGISRYIASDRGNDVDNYNLYRLTQTLDIIYIDIISIIERIVKFVHIDSLRIKLFLTNE